MKLKSIVLVVILLAIVGSIFFLESTKVHVSGDVVNADLSLETVAKKNTQEKTEVVRELSTLDKERIAAKAQRYERAKELVNPQGFINVDNITIAEHLGKDVILVDFWTYSCVNCQRTLPYLTQWHEKYADKGLVIIGVHAPEFAFEQEYDNVVAATKKWDVTYPVVQDNNFETWRAYKNRFWPRKYLIDIDGFIVYDHIGEGAYKETEEKIQDLLSERNEVVGLDEEVMLTTVVDPEQKRSKRTPEVYFGYDFARDQLGNSNGWQAGEVVEYVLPEALVQDMFYLEGSWRNNPGSMELMSEKGKIVLPFTAREVNIVAGAKNEQVIEVFLDGEKVKDVTVQKEDLYNLVDLSTSAEHTLELRVPQGVMAYTFTFG